MELLSMPPRLTDTDKAKGKKMLARFIKYSIASMIFTAIAFFALSLSAPANAVTYGETVGDPKTESPWAVSIWVSEENDASDAIPICTGTLISSKLVLTAAHCVLENISYFVKVGAVNLQDSTELLAVSNRWKNPKYNPKSLGNDIGLLQLAEEVSVGKLPSLSTPSLEKQVKGAKLTIYGWGRDHTLKVTNLLNKSALRNQDAQAARIWAKSFNKNTMLAAGTYLPKEKLFSGGCNGDSGGPLVARIDGALTLVGVTSWGSAKCDSSKPTIFARVSVFGPAIKQGITYLKSSSTTINQAPPVNISLPTISGTLQPEQTITCNPGTWKNAVAISISWSSPARLSGSINPKVKVTDADAGQAFTCQVVATSTQASLRKSIELVAPSKPEIRSYPTISGIPSSGSLKPDSLAICDGQSWSGAYQTESQSWYLSTNSKSPLLSNPQLLSSEKSFKITSDFIKSNSGKFLVCAAKAENNGFTTTTTVVRQIIAPTAPIIYGVYLSVNSFDEGALATCDFKASTEDYEQKIFEWGYGDKSTFTPITGSNNNSLKISGGLIRSAAGQFLSCRLTLTNLGGNTSATGYSSERFPSAPTDLSYKVYNSGGWTEGAYMVCDGSQTSTSKILSVQKSWGITDANGNGFIGAPISTSDRLFVSNDLLISMAGKTLGCLVNATNAIGSTQRMFTTPIPISVAPSLPIPGNLTISKQEALASSITVTITIPSLSTFSSSTMDARLRFPNTSCDNRQITSFPSTITCTGLPAQTAFAPYLTIGYITNSTVPQSRSASASFTTISLAPVIAMPTCNRFKTIVTYGALPTFDSSKTTFQLYAIRNIGANQSVTATGMNPQGGIWNVDFIDISDMANYTLRVVRLDPSGETFANCAETQTAPNDATAPQVSLTDLSQYSPIAPTSISVGQNVTATFRLTDDIGITSCGATVYNVNNVDTTTNTVCTKILGTASNGVWQVTLNLNSSNNPGAYTIKAFGTDASGKTSTRVQVGSFTIVGPSVSNLTTMPTLQTIGINYVDQIVLNGINFGSISPNSPGSYTWTVRVTNSAGTIITTVPVGSNQTYITGLTGSTTYKVYLVATDSSGATKLSNALTVTTLVPADSQNPVVVIGSGVLTTSTLPSSGGTVAVTYRVTDDVGCCSYHQAWMYYPNGTVVQQVTPALISGDEKNGTFRASFTVPSGVVAGSYQIKAQALDNAGKYTDLQLLGTVTVSAPAPLIATDIYITSDQNFKSELSYPFRAALAQNSGPIAGVTITFWIDGVARTAVTDSNGVAIWTQNSHTSGKTSYSVYATYGGSATLAASTSPTRVITKYVAPTDSQNPVVVVGSGVLTTSSLETSGGTVAVTYRVTDDVGCCSYHQAWMYYPNGTVVQQVTPALISGDEKNGTFRASFTVPSGVVAGSYQIKAQALDNAGKYTDLQLLGTVTVSAPAPLQIVSGSLQTSLAGSQNRILNSFRVISGAPVSSIGISFKNSLNQNVGGGPIQNYRVSGTATDGVYQDNSIMSGDLWFPNGKTSEVISVYASASNTNGESVPSVLLGTFTATSPCPGYRAYLPANQSVALCMFNNHYYGVVTGSYTWDAARALANSYNYAGSNGYLVHITSTEERNFITSLVTAGTSYWIGATDSPAEGCWRWVDGPTSETGAAFLQKAGAVCEIPVVPGYNGFASNQPDDWGSGEDHASLWGGPEWNDANNTINPYPFVFEIGN